MDFFTKEQFLVIDFYKCPDFVINLSAPFLHSLGMMTQSKIR